MNTIRIAKMLIGINLKKSIPAIMTVTTFLLVLNVLLGILFSTTGIFSNSITENSSVHFMEIVNEGDPNDVNNINMELKKSRDVRASFIDVSHPVVMSCNNESGMEVYTIVGIPCELLPELKLSASSDQFLFLPKADKNSFNGMSRVEFEETLYIDKGNGVRAPELKCFEYEITDFYEPIQWDLFPESIAIIDEKTAMEIANGMSVDGMTIPSDRVIANVLDVSKMQALEQAIKKRFPNTDVRYALKHTGQLPNYATVFIAVSGMIIAILLVFCIINIRSSIKEILNTRQRDIGLFSLFGVQSKMINRVFIIEFTFNGVLSFLITSLITGIVFAFLDVAFSIDLISSYYLIYLVSNAIISVFMFVFIAIVQVRRALKRINQAKIFKEFLK